MTSPQEKYENDPSYRALVEMLESFIHKCQYSPSELREAALLACIRYESLTIRPRVMFPRDEGVGEPGVIKDDVDGKYRAALDRLAAEQLALSEQEKEIERLRRRLVVLENQAQGYYNQASQGWTKFNEAERKIASQAKEIERMKNLCAELIGPDVKKEGE